MRERSTLRSRTRRNPPLLRYINENTTDSGNLYIAAHPDRSSNHRVRQTVHLWRRNRPSRRKGSWLCCQVRGPSRSWGLLTKYAVSLWSINICRWNSSSTLSHSLIALALRPTTTACLWEWRRSRGMIREISRSVYHRQRHITCIEQIWETYLNFDWFLTTFSRDSK